MRYVISNKLKSGKIIVRKSHQHGALIKEMVDLPVFDASAKTGIKIVFLLQGYVKIITLFFIAKFRQDGKI